MQTKDEALKELEEVKKKLRNPKGGMFGTRKLYHRMGELYKVIDAEDTDDQPETTSPA